jgi:hypothetical protein
VDIIGQMTSPTATAVPADTATPVPPPTQEAEAPPTATRTPNADKPPAKKATSTPESDPGSETTSDGATLEVLNASGMDVWYLFVAPTEEDMWGDDRLGDEILFAGDTTVVEGLPPGLYDIQALDEEENVIETIWEIDLTGDANLTLTGQATLEVNNMTDVAIGELLVSPVEADTWGDNMLADAIPAWETTTLEGLSPGWYDLKALDATGETIEAVFQIELTSGSFWNVTGKVPLPDNATLRFEDSFDDNRNSWGEIETEEVKHYAPSDGTYCTDIKVAELTAWEWYEPFRTEEFVAEVGCQIDEETDATCGLGFGPDGDNLYWFEVSPFDQTYALFLLLNDEWQEPLVDWTVSKNISDIDWNMLSMERIGDTVSIYVNGIWLADVEEATLDEGRIGIGGASYDDPGITFCLDNLRVWELD